VLAAYQAGLTACFAQAVQLGLDIFITPHVDDGGPATIWRNALKLDPIAPYGPWSYLSVLIRPMAEALNQVARKGMKVWFCMQVSQAGQGQGQWDCAGLEQVQNCCGMSTGYRFYRLYTPWHEQSCIWRCVPCRDTARPAAARALLHA
jgi:hypothetical protein